MISRLLCACLLVVIMVAVPHGAMAGDPAVREIQRLLLSLKYRVPRLDGVMSGDTTSQIQKFLSDRGKSSLTSNEEIVGELKSAFDELRTKTISESGNVTGRVKLVGSDDVSARMVISPSDDIVLITGSCPINRVRLSDSAPLRPFTICTRAASQFVLSETLHLLVFQGCFRGGACGLVTINEASGLFADFIDIPGMESITSKFIEISPEGKEVLVQNKSDLLRVDLDTRSSTRIMHLPGGEVTDITFSPDGRYYSVHWSKLSDDNKFTHASIIERSGDRKLHEFIDNKYSHYITFSADGRFFAALNAQDSAVVEIRETTSSRTVNQRTFGESESSPSFFSWPGRSVAFNRDGTGLLYVDADNKVLLEWDFKSGKIRDVLKLNTKPDRSELRVSEGRLVTIEGTDVLTYNLQGQSESNKAHIALLKVKGGEVSSDQKLLLAFAGDAIAIMDLESGRVRTQSVVGTTNITSAAFMPGSQNIVVGTEDGAIFALEDGTRRNLAKLNDSIDVLVSARSNSLVAARSGKKVYVIDVARGHIVAQVDSVGSGWASRNNLAFVDNDSRLLFDDHVSHRIIALDIASGRRVLGEQIKSGVQKAGKRTTWYWSSISFIAPNRGNPGAFLVGVRGGVFGPHSLYEYANGRLTTMVGGPESTTSFKPAGSEVGDSSEDGALIVCLGNTPITQFVGASKYASRHDSLQDDPVFVKALSGDRFLTLDKSSEVRIYSRSSTSPLVRTFLYAEDNWLSRTEQGFFVGTKLAAENLYLTRGSSGSVPLDSAFNALYRPELVAEAIRGDASGKVKAAATQLDLEKVVASGMAPKVAITSPATGSVSPTDEAAVDVSIVDRGGGIGKVEWRVNGVTMGLESRGIDRVADQAAGPASGRMEAVRRTLSLEPGNNRIEVLAFNAKGLIASQPAEVTVTWDGTSAAAPPRLYVLAVGVNDYYDSRLRLAYAVPDAIALAEGFRKAGTGLYASVEVKTVLDSEVTLTNLDRVFADFSAKVQPRDVFVFFLAGHGKTKQGRYYFLPRDFRYQDEASIENAGMGQDKFQAWFAGIRARKSLLLYDTCESGSLTGATRGSDVDERLGALNRMARATGRTFLTATSDDAPALEGYRGHGVFTYALLDALGQADVNRNGLIEVSELADYIDEKVPDYSFEAFKLRQIPQRSIVGNNFALTNKAEVLGSLPAAAATNAAPIPTKPTHVVLVPVDVKDDASDSATSVTQLPPGTQIHLIESVNGWVLIARDGRKLGYVQESAVAGLQ